MELNLYCEMGKWKKLSRTIGHQEISSESHDSESYRGKDILHVQYEDICSVRLKFNPWSQSCGKIVSHWNLLKPALNICLSGAHLTCDPNMYNIWSIKESYTHVCVLTRWQIFRERTKIFLPLNPCLMVWNVLSRFSGNSMLKPWVL